jgi:isoquinoline 1-oxidoreductase beta subunit
MTTKDIDRGSFLRSAAAAGAGLSIAFTLPSRVLAATPEPASGATGFAPNAWLRFAPDESVTIFVSRAEMGQGVATGMPTLVADELDVAFNRVKIAFAPSAPEYGSPEYGGDQITGGSTSVAGSWIPLRTAGATARTILVATAAKQWSVDPASCTTHEGVVTHKASGRTATYGSLAVAASAMPVPDAKTVVLKTPDAFTLIGKNQKRLDIPAKANGSAQYGIDFELPGMVWAAIARSPVFGGTVKSVNDKKARAVSGVTGVVTISNGVAVIATNTWAAFQGKLALEIVWNDGPVAKKSTASMFAEAEHLAKTRSGEKIALTRGTPDAQKGTVLEAVYKGPFLAHATMEPMNATAWVKDDSCEIWAPNQVQQRGQRVAAKVTGFPLDKITVHTTYLGGGFGRRLEADYMQEAVEVSKAIKKPVKVTWTREDDIQHDFYRSMSVNTMRGVLAGGTVTALTTTVVQPSWLKHWMIDATDGVRASIAPDTHGGVDFLAVAGVIDSPYTIPHMRLGYIDYEPGIPAGSWRAPNANWNSFVVESFIDELAHAAHQDPLAFRRKLLAKNPRALAVLDLAAEKAGYGKAHPGVKQGLAVTFWGGSYSGMVVDVSMAGGLPKVHRVVTAVDCGIVVNPDIVKQQSEGSALFGLSAALTGNITIDKGRVMQHNFYDYTVLRMADAPVVDVHIVPSTEKPTGIGEICTPPIAPAVGNAIFALTGKRVRSLPFSEALA